MSSLKNNCTKLNLQSNLQPLSSHSMLVRCWPGVSDARPTQNQYEMRRQRLQISVFCRIIGVWRLSGLRCWLCRRRRRSCWSLTLLCGSESRPEVSRWWRHCHCHAEDERLTRHPPARMITVLLLAYAAFQVASSWCRSIVTGNNVRHRKCERKRIQTLKCSSLWLPNR